MIDFYFDFSLPYGYIMATRIDTIGAIHGREVRWRACIWEELEREIVSGGLVMSLRSDYVLHDVERMGRRFGVPFNVPLRYPFSSRLVTEIWYSMLRVDEKKARNFAKMVYAKTYIKGITPDTIEVLREICKEVGYKEIEIEEIMSSEGIEREIEGVHREALSVGVEGLPMLVIGRERFWGIDKLAEVEEWLESPW